MDGETSLARVSREGLSLKIDAPVLSRPQESNHSADHLQVDAGQRRAFLAATETKLSAGFLVLFRCLFFSLSSVKIADLPGCQANLARLEHSKLGSIDPLASW